MSHRALTLTFGLALVAGTLAWTQLDAAKHNRVVDIGDRAPAWSDLPATNGETVGLDSFADSKAVAVIFTCNECPVAIVYEDRLMKFAADYKDKGVSVVAINVNKGEDLEAMRQRAEEKGFNFPYVRDDSQKSAREYGATCTPHVFLLDANRKIAYMGAIDDNLQEGKVKQHYLRDAADAVLAGKEPATTESQQQGCGIAWKN
jgi:peroxiredoxin